MEYHQWPFNADNILEWALRKIEFVNSVLKRKRKGFLFLNPISIFFLINYFIQITKQILIVFSEILIILAVLGRIYCFVGGNISFSEANIINDAIFLSQYVYIINNLWWNFIIILSFCRFLFWSTQKVKKNNAKNIIKKYNTIIKNDIRTNKLPIIGM